MTTFEKILFAATGLVLVLGAAWAMQGWLSWRGANAYGTSASQPLSYSQAKQAEDPNNPCATPAGYTDESWREHMGHHPDQYKQCLGNL